MKKSLIFLIICCLAISSIAGCRQIDEDYGVSSTVSKAKAPIVSYPENIEIPTIKSLDTQMSLFFDLSLYDEENYSKIYLGKDYKFNTMYDGVSIKLPATLKDISEYGWSFAPGQNYNKESSIHAGLMIETVFANKNNKLINVFFYNESNSSVKLDECPIVRVEIPTNNIVTKNDSYGDFNVNGVSNASAITDIIQSLGAPSHFHADSKSVYTLDWFKSEDDRRNKISVTISLDDDCVISIAVSNYFSEDK